MKSQSMYIEEVNRLINGLDITAEDAMEIINIYFEFFAEAWTYVDYLYRNIRIIKDDEVNQPLIAELSTINDICLFEGDGYYMITNYDALLQNGDIEDCLRNPF